MPVPVFRVKPLLSRAHDINDDILRTPSNLFVLAYLEEQTLPMFLNFVAV